MSETERVLYDYVMPSIGSITAILLAGSPLPAVLRARANRSLGDLNPLPLAFVVANGIVWVVYGLHEDNTNGKPYFIIIPNLIFFLLGLFYMHSTSALASPRDRMIQDIVSIGGCGIVLLCGVAAFVSLADNHKAGKDLLGCLAIAILGLYYTSPLSTLYRVIKTRNSALFLVPLAVTAFINGACWTLFGLLSKKPDPFIWAPNLVGTIFAVIQLVCRLIFPARTFDASSDDGSSKTEVESTSVVIQIADSKQGEKSAY